MWQCIKCETKNKGEKCIICHEAKPVSRSESNVKDESPVAPVPHGPSVSPKPIDSHGVPVSPGATRAPMAHGTATPYGTAAPHGSREPSPPPVTSGTPASITRTKPTKNLLPLFGTLAVVLLVICGVVFFFLLRDSQTNEIARPDEDQPPIVAEEDGDEEIEELELAEVPDLSGLSEEEAIAAIERAGLVVGDITTAYSEDWTEGEVFEVSETIGQEVEVGTPISFMVSLGPEILYANPFDTSVWGRNNVKQITQGGLSLDIPVPSVISADDVVQQEDWSFFINERRDGGYFLINVIFYTDRGTEDFRNLAEESIYNVADFLNTFDDNSGAYVESIHEVDGTVMGLINFESVEWGETVEIVSINEYHGWIVMTRLRLHGDVRVRTIDFLRAYGFNKFVEAGYLAVY